MRTATSCCEDCNKPTLDTDLFESRDSSDGNKYLMCSVCRRKHNNIFQAELEEHYAAEQAAALADHAARHPK